MPADRRILELSCFLLGCEEFDVFAQRSLVAFQREDIIGFLVHDLRGDFALAADGVDGDDGAFERIMSSNAGMAVISLDFSFTLTWPRTNRWRAAKDETMWIGCFDPFFW